MEKSLSTDDVPDNVLASPSQNLSRFLKRQRLLVSACIDRVTERLLVAVSLLQIAKLDFNEIHCRLRRNRGPTSLQTFALGAHNRIEVSFIQQKRLMRFTGGKISREALIVSFSYYLIQLSNHVQ